jgi:transcriptional antiterminator NusG
MGNYIFDIVVPTEKVSTIRRNEKTNQVKKVEMNRKFFPGYVLANMDLLQPDGTLNKDVWYFILQTDGVISFAGTKDKPMPIPERQVKDMLAQIAERSQTVQPEVKFEVGDTIRVTDGAFQSEEGIIEEVDPEHGKIRVSVHMFERDIPLELEFWQVEKA